MSASIQVEKKLFGLLSDGTQANLYKVSNGHMSFTATDYGCTLTGIFLPHTVFGDASDDILLGFSTLDGIVHRNQPYFGVLVGRYANRIKNARFTLNGTIYNTDRNENGNTLHSGFRGYNTFVWNSEIVETESAKGVKFSRLSPDGEQGFPGNLSVEALYLLNDANEITLHYTAKTDAPTPVNLTNHAYFNLSGSCGVLGESGTQNLHTHTMHIPGTKRLEVDELLLPTGKIVPVAGSAYDFTAPKPLAKHFDTPELAATGGGYDTCYCFGKEDNAFDSENALRTMATVSESSTGRTMTCRSNQDCLQLYTASYLNAVQGKNLRVYNKFSGFCLETQGYLDAVNVPSFPSSIINADETYESKTVYAFTF
ncbi:MAG: galactose mutarotase [Treponemataceae bacterium]|nr:MAG: galactose mutarotase [Treponemataceae bacterium]